MSGRYDDENIIIKDWQYFLADETVFFLTNSAFERRIYRAISKQWNKWTINNSHDALPPDFFSEKLGLMFDIVRVFDSEIETVDEHNRIQRRNPVLAEESKLFKQCLQEHPDAKPENVFVLAKPEDNYHSIHTYQQYCAHTNRVIGEHLSKLAGWKERHTKCKMGLWIFDETAAYIQHMYLKDAQATIDQEAKYIFHPRPHWPILDKNLTKQLFDSSLDFFIWVAPYKYNAITNEQMPATTFVDLKNKKINKIRLIDYPSELMRCT